MKKTFALLLSILFLLAASGCKRTVVPPDDPVEVSIDTPEPMATSVPIGYTPAPYQEPTDEPADTEAPSENFQFRLEMVMILQVGIRIKL